MSTATSDSVGQVKKIALAGLSLGALFLLYKRFVATPAVAVAKERKKEDDTSSSSSSSSSPADVHPARPRSDAAIERLEIDLSNVRFRSAVLAMENSESIGRERLCADEEGERRGVAVRALVQLKRWRLREELSRSNQLARDAMHRDMMSEGSPVRSAGAVASLADLTPEDLATTQRFAARLPARYRLPHAELELGEHLTSGGMGAVMAARLRSTREQSVVKISKDRDPNAVRRFLREIFISLTVPHRFIARPLGVAFETGGVAGIEALLVLERGVCSLEDFVAAKRQQQQQQAAAEVSDAEIEQYFGFAQQIGTAMAFLHARGVLHLDQKPANVVLFSSAAAAAASSSSSSSSGALSQPASDSFLANVDFATLNTAKIVDLGLAVLSLRRPEEEGFGGDALTHLTGTLPGATIAYASHEQATARPDTKLRPTMDVYSFGATLYRLLCVAKPHEGRNAVEILQHKLIDDAMNEDNLLPAFRAANNEDESSPRYVTARQLVTVMRMCLQHEPERRPQTGTDVLKLLLREGEVLPPELAAASPASSSAGRIDAASGPLQGAVPGVSVSSDFCLRTAVHV
jgi:serine/threonine protein kinase